MSTMRDERPARTELGRSLLASATMNGDWAAPFAAVDRADFLPDLMWPFDAETGQAVAVSRTDDPATWYGYVDANVPIVTQWDDGQHTGTKPGTVSTSSASMPSVVFAMLDDLAIRPGMRVLEVGTGTGWNAALLAQRLGNDHVTTIEVDELVASAARAALRRAGHTPTVVSGDGLLGYKPNAPYDRIIVTCGLRTIPPAWIEQTKPGGLILAPWGTDYTHQDAVARLTVADDGKSAAGRFTGPVQFMKARSQRLTWPQHEKYVPDGWQEGAEQNGTDLRPEDISAGAFSIAEFAIGLAVPDVTHTLHRQDGIQTAWVYSLSDTSWAAAVWRDGRPAAVYQCGPRRLWDEVAAAHYWWDEHGRPGFDRYGLTITPHGQTVWLDEAQQIVR